jgi:microcystin-dependent protein
MASVSLPIRSVIPHYMEAANETLPAGWVVAAGQLLNSTQQDVIPGGNWTVPDLRNRFIIGADHTKTLGTAAVLPTDGNIDAAAGAPGAQAMGGGNGQALTEAQLPTHTHPQTGTSVTVTAATHNHGGLTQGGSPATGGNHTHGGTGGGAADGAHAHPIHYASITAGGNWWNADNSFGFAWSGTADPIDTFYGGGEGHEHGINTEAAHGHTMDTVNMGSHTHTFTLSGGTTGNAGSGANHEGRHQYAAMVYIIKVKN